MEVICPSETSVHILTTRRYISEDGDVRNYRYENLASYKKLNPFPVAQLPGLMLLGIFTATVKIVIRTLNALSVAFVLH
jgi:hypothetical protein